jgi:Mor family transcriptional regulator
MVIKHPPPNPKRDNAIYDLRKTGMSLDLIGKRYSLSSTRVGQIIRREQLRREK